MISTINHPKNQQEYRERTNNPSMAGVTSPRFYCGGCHGYLTTIGRKKTKDGFRCRWCLAED